MLRIIIALVVGVFVGGAVNMGLILLGPTIIPVPDGVDVSDSESIAASMHLFQPKHFLFPFLAHAVGTFTGALIAHLITSTYRNPVAYAVGALFFAGGVASVTMIPAPVWFSATDLILAYFPMAFLAAAVGSLVRPADSA